MGGTKQNGAQALNMDMNHPDNTISFTKKKGCYMSPTAACFFIVLFVSSIVATGFLVFYYTSEIRDIVDDVKHYFGSLSDQPENDDTINIPVSTTIRIATKDPSTYSPDVSSTEVYIDLGSNASDVDILDTRYDTTGIPVDSSSQMPVTDLPSDEINILMNVQPELSSPTSSGLVKRSRRLPRALKPAHYTVKLQPFVNGNFSIRGYVEIEMDVLENTSNITLHIADIITNNDSVTLRKLHELGEPEVQILKHEFDPNREFYIAHLAEPLEKGSQCRLAMEFEGYLNDNMKGFYRSHYQSNDGRKKYLAATQFQASDARRAFPCFDEPGFKATFDIFLAREENMKTLSNMPIIGTLPVSEQEGWVWDQYNTTVPMSTYLIAFAVSDFVSLEEINEDWMFRVWARESAIQQAEYALDIGPRMLRHFETFFNIPFPLPKLDMIALPDFAPGAMENWGLVTFRETLMLYHPSTSAAYNKELVAAVTGHELAHQWFGNLVTPQWWTDIWLNEGFASYVEYIGVDHVEPSFQVMQLFVLKRIHGIFHMDSLESSHPIRHNAENADKIAYDKGSSVIRMMNHFLTDETFTKGLNNYLRAFQYANAEQDDLWHYLTMAAHEDTILPLNLTVKEIMDTWTLQMGYPVIKIIRSQDGTTATVSQERFLQIKNENSTDDHDYKWWVPLTFTEQNASDFSTTKPKLWIKPTEAAITLEGLPSSDHWVIFNIQQTNFYRVNYDDNNWQLIINQLLTNHSIINTINRAQIIDDTMNFAKAGHLPYSTPLSLFRYLKDEHDYVPWAAALNNMAYLRKMFKSTEAYGALKKYLLDIILPHYNSVGFEDSADDSLLVQYRRQKLLSWSCVLEHQHCLNQSANLFKAWMAAPNNSRIVSPNLKSMVYCRAIQEGGEEEWNFAWQQYLSSNVASEKEQLLSAMGCTQDQGILLKYLNMAFSEGSGIRKQDSRRVFSAVASNPVGNTLAWNFLKNNWNRIYNFFDKIIVHLINASSQNFNSLQQLNELQMFTEEHEGQFNEEEKLKVKQLLENVHNNLSWMNNYYNSILEWLQGSGYSTSLQSEGR